MKKLLALSGGGMRGLPEAALLADIERRTSKPIASLFDHISGTSIGGIVAALLAAGMSASEAVSFFTEDGPKIFSKHWWRTFGLFCPRYPAKAVEDVLRNRFGDLKLKDCKTNLLVTSLDLVSQEPYFFKSYEPTPNYFLWQVGRATSAAQTYFPGFRLEGKILWDGGNVANNPAVCAVADATNLWPGERLKVMSLGCGAAKANINPKSLINAGILRAGLASVALLFETGAEDTDYQLEQALGDDYMSLQPKFARDVALDDASPQGLAWLNEAAMRFVTDNGVEVYNFLKT